MLRSLGATTIQTVSRCYLFWGCSLEIEPFYGNIGKVFVSELARLESVALKAALVMPILLLQKPSQKAKTRDLITCLERRMKIWHDGDLNELTLEGRAIQHCLPQSLMEMTSALLDLLHSWCFMERPRQPFDSWQTSLQDIPYSWMIWLNLEIHLQRRSGISYLTSIQEVCQQTQIRLSVMSCHQSTQ